MRVWKPVYIHDSNCVTPLGDGIAETWRQVTAGNSAIKQQDVGTIKNVFVAKVQHEMHRSIAPAATESLLEQLLLRAAEPLLKKRQPNPRTALVLATTKGEIGYLSKGHSAGALLTVLAKKLAHKMNIVTEPIVVSQACVSGVLAISVAKRLIQMGLFEDAFVLAGDEASEFVLSGFQAFQAMSPFPCKPFDKHRAGVTIGEAAACMYLSAVPGRFVIRGEGAINDANHISGPSRQGEGLYRSVRQAIKEAGIRNEDIDFISAHGTATLYNDEMEAIAFNRLGLAHVPLNSLKGYFGHTLGAAGLLETTVSLKAMEEGVLLPTLGFQELGTTQPLQVVRRSSTQPIPFLLKTASGFGGSNAAIIIEKVC
ncbi:beta-ketoacyl synthase N-terminal-like domain-containing protein [Sphingobacterium griseoflavum]|uniref:Beta-ketoacyl synthase n=1 Tax=Sphingobacterium griseoflavum TaxID=1474952 RepID=A0ABQ3I191_9SPHI|nr:beta-ketoacyl synthase N-terminal-like domain-containing protein [Sphingobacterium griseoflavum]GHE40623.1 beta-ketoacyl synthase [Sphingobacterium griseoflavum]